MFPKSLISVDTNAKTVKGQQYGFATAILYMAPADISGVNLCPMAEVAQCKAACLYSAGRGAFNSVQQSRINKARLFLTQRAEFMRRLALDIAKHIASATAGGFIPLVRLNGTTDIRWENESVSLDAATAKKIGVPAGEYENLMAVFPTVQFYDYTKIANRKNIPANYDLTFSYSGVAGYQKYVQRAIQSGMRVAVVFRKREEIPAEFLGMECVDGDDSDIRHLDPQGVVVALYAKGAAKRDATGFVVDAAARRVISIIAA